MKEEEYLKFSNDITNTYEQLTKKPNNMTKRNTFRLELPPLIRLKTKYATTRFIIALGKKFVNKPGSMLNFYSRKRRGKLGKIILLYYFI